MPASDWWKYDGREDEQDDELAALEAQALKVLHDLQDYDKRHPHQVLVVGAMARKVSTVFGSFAQSVGLRTATLRHKAVT